MVFNCNTYLCDLSYLYWRVGLKCLNFPAFLGNCWLINKVIILFTFVIILISNFRLGRYRNQRKKIIYIGNARKMAMLEVSFKPNSTPQNRLVRWGLHPTYILWIDLNSSRCATSNTPHHAEVYSSRAWD